MINWLISRCKKTHSRSLHKREYYRNAITVKWSQKHSCYFDSIIKMNIRKESVNCCPRRNWQPIDKDSKKNLLNALDFDSLFFFFSLSLPSFVKGINTTICITFKAKARLMSLYLKMSAKNAFDGNMRWSCFDYLRLSPSFGLVMICVFFFQISFPFCLSFVVDTFRLNAITVWAKRMIRMAHEPVKWVS